MNITSVELSFQNLNHQSHILQGQEVTVITKVFVDQHEVTDPKKLDDFDYDWTAIFGPYKAPMAKKTKEPWIATFESEGVEFGTYAIHVTVTDRGNRKEYKQSYGLALEVRPPATLRGGGAVTLGRSSVAETKDVALWQALRQASKDLSFAKYDAFITEVMTGGRLDNDEHLAMRRLGRSRGTPFAGIDTYQLLKTATEVFVMLNCRVLEEINLSDPELVADYNGRNDRHRSGSDLNRLWDRYLEHTNSKGPGTETLPYLALIRRKLGDHTIIAQDPKVRGAVEALDGILQEKLSRPCLFELIWSYWQEEGMLVQTMNAIALRFQNQRGPQRDPLANFTLSSIDGLRGIIFGYIQDEQHRLTVARRAYEYDHQYGFTLQGKAVPTLRSADSRSTCLPALHNVLAKCEIFYQQDDNTTIIADGFPLLNALKEAHMVLAEGAHNQFGDLPTTARIEMLIQQWILARPEIRDFLGSRPMVPYAEPWMDRVDAMKKLQGWTDVSVTHFNDLARLGEQIIGSIRLGSWSQVLEARSATNWARDFRPEIQQYLHAAEAVLGFRVTDPAVPDRNAAPSVHLRRRLELQQAGRTGGTAAPRRGSAVRNGGNGHGNTRVAANRPAGTHAEVQFSEDF